MLDTATVPAVRHRRRPGMSRTGRISLPVRPPCHNSTLLRGVEGCPPAARPSQLPAPRCCDVTSQMGCKGGLGKPEKGQSPSK